ncbi:MAG: hypothetical protein ACRD0P_03165 [Stackebrandtia sp.]
MTTPEEVRAKANEVREAANDLRFLEVTGLLIGDPRFTAGDVAGQGDTGVGRYDDYDASMIGDRIKAVQAQQGTPLGTEFDWVVDYFEYYTRITNEPYDAMLGSLDQIRVALAGVDEHIPDIQSRFQLTDWDGPFARNLQGNLFSPLESVKLNQINLVKELQAAVQAHWSLVVAVRRAVFEIGEATRVRLQAHVNLQQPDPNKAAMPVVGAILAVAGIAAAIPTGGASVTILPMALAIAGGVKATAEAVVAVKEELADNPSDEQMAIITGSTAADIMSSMLGEIGALDKLIGEEESKLNGKLNTTIQNLDEWLADTGGEKASGAKAKSWNLQSFRSELADGLPSPKEMSNPE